MLFLREMTIFPRNQSENTRSAKIWIYVCYADIGWSMFHNNSKKESFALQKFPIFTCYSYERLRFFPEINQRMREGRKCGYSFVMPILSGQSYLIDQEKNPLHYKNSLLSHVILTRNYDFCQKSIRECAKGKNADIRLLCRYFMVSLTQLFK